MIESVYPYIVGSTTQGARMGREVPRTGAGSGYVDPKTVVAGEKGASASLTAGEGIRMDPYGSIIQASNGLFAEVYGVIHDQEMPRMVLLQRSYEATLKAFQAQDEIVKHTLDTFV